jgi:8-oxo-dGTP diphosphatase
MNYVDVVAGVIWRNGRFIATQRVHGRHAGFWELPGGKVEAGESLLRALARELHEELGVTLEKVHRWRTVHHLDGDRRIRLHVYHVTRFSGEPQALEQQTLCWWTGPEACNLPFLETDIQLVRELAGILEPAAPSLAAAFDGVVPPLLETTPAL